jgi:hypothetical protein
MQLIPRRFISPGADFATRRCEMHTIQVYIDDTLDERQLAQLREKLLQIPHIKYVGLNPRLPHHLLVEYEQHHVMPMDIVRTLHGHGMHPDVIAC